MNSINLVLKLIFICFCFYFSIYFFVFVLVNSFFIDNVVLKFRSNFGSSMDRKGSCVTLNNGAILFIYSNYVSENGDGHDSAFLASGVSSDDGIIWSTNDKIVLEKKGMMSIISVSLLGLNF